MPIVRTFAAPAAPSGDVVVPELVDTLEWVIESPPNIHQFDEPPVRMPDSILSLYSCELLIHGRFLASPCGALFPLDALIPDF